MFAITLITSCKLETKGIVPPINSDSTDTLIIHPLTISSSLIASRHINVIKYFGSTCYLGGDDGLLLYGSPNSGFARTRYTDAAAIWDMTYSNQTFIACGAQSIFRTLDGNNWDTVVSGIGSVFIQSATDGEGRIWVLGNNTTAPFVGSAPFGPTNWTQYHYLAGSSDIWFGAIAFHPLSHRGYIAGRTNGYRTTDDGLTWGTALGLPDPASTLFFISQSELFIGSTNGTIGYSADFGFTWQHVNLTGLNYETVNKIIQIGDRSFVAVTSYYTPDGTGNRRGRIYMTTDIFNWKMIADVNHEIRDIVNASGQGILMCGSEGYLAALERH